MNPNNPLRRLALRTLNTGLKVNCAVRGEAYPSHRVKQVRIAVVGFLGAWALACGPLMPLLADAPAGPSKEETALPRAICPIVYPLDQSPSDRGIHYTFYGNGFFINSDGYLLTAAHVLSQLSGTQPYIVLRLPMAPPHLLKVEVIAMDWEHDVALLRATPNPFQGKYQVRFLPLAVQRPAPTQAVLAAALRPSRLRDPYTFDALVEDRPAGEVLGYEFSQLEKGNADTKLLLFSHEVLLGDSGAPVLSAESQAVVGLVEGRWLRTNAASIATAMKQSTSGVGAAVPIHYAIPLLQQQGVTWHAAPQEAKSVAPTSAVSVGSTAAIPLSLVAAPHPSQALQGGDVVLEAGVNREGELVDIEVVRGAPPFLDKALSAVHTWSFLPGRVNGDPAATRIGIIFQFASPSGLPNGSRTRQYHPALAATHDRAALPVVTTEPQAFSTKIHAEASVILDVQIDAQGKIAAMNVIEDTESLATSVAAAVHEWQFVPGVCASVNCDSTLIIVVVSRQSASPVNAQSNRQPDAH